MTEENPPVSRIALFGRPRQLWPVAALLSRELPARIDLVLVEEDGDDPPAGLSLACAGAYHERLGMGAGEIVAQSRATLGLGVDYRDWQGEGSRFFSAASGSLPSVDGVALHQIMLRAARLYEQPERLAHLYQPFRFCARAAMAGKLALGSDHPASPRTMLGPTLQCDADAYAALCREKAGEGARLLRGARPVELRYAADGAALCAVRLENGEEIEADLFVDLSGAVSALVPRTDRPAIHSPAMTGAFDRTISGRCAYPVDHRHRLARALPGGVLVETPVGEGSVAELLFSSTRLDEAAARDLIGGEGESAAFEGYATQAPWTGNLARLGLASARLGPHLSADMLLLQAQALHLADSIPARRLMDVEAAAFNRKQADSLARICDFGFLPFLLNTRGEELWKALRQTPPSATLELRLAQFRSRGRFVTFDRELFDEQSWIEMMIGFGIVP
ncbi:MAG: tryptophan 7-halogenase, partial [Sphingomonadales bacterium]|nr:tryptophan 7-halogenase [Sphingomonadales bacterium]